MAQQLTTVTSPLKPRLITISPRTPSSNASSQPISPQDCGRALVSAFSPISPTESETPEVANQIEVDDDHPIFSKHGKQGLGTLVETISYPITPPTSRVPTPIGTTTPLCLRTGSRCVQPSMTHLDHSTEWILQELETLMARFPATSLRLNSPVVKRIRSTSSASMVPDTASRHRSITAPHSRFSPYRPLTSHPTTPQVSSQSAPSSPTNLKPNALRIVFPTAPIHSLESLQATFLAFHYISDFPFPDQVPSSVRESARSSYIPSAKPSRSSSLLFNIPSKAREMLGLVDSPTQALMPVASQGRSWFHSHSSEPDSELMTRLENLKLLLESSVRRILVDIEGRALEKRDDVLVRAVGEVVRLGERKQ